MFVGLLLYVRSLKRVPLGIDDYMLLLAFIIALILVTQTTWAIVDEGQDKHLNEISGSRLALVFKVWLL